jgi:hypothetical protein
VSRLITIYWRDIPAQVIGLVGRTRVKRELPPRFGEAIDRAAMRAGRTSSDAYLADWRRETRPCEGELERAVEAEVAGLVERFPEELVERMVRAGGVMRSAAG